jgi:mRNA interferase YafQ
MARLREVILPLIQGNPLPARYQDHPLRGEWSHHRDCHIEPDWLLIYKVNGDDLYLVRTGTHSDVSESCSGARPRISLGVESGDCPTQSFNDALSDGGLLGVAAPRALGWLPSWPARWTRPLLIMRRRACVTITASAKPEFAKSLKTRRSHIRYQQSSQEALRRDSTLRLPLPFGRGTRAVCEKERMPVRRRKESWLIEQSRREGARRWPALGIVP